MQGKTSFLLTLLTVSCVACEKKEAVNATQLEQVILADKRATAPICVHVTVPPVDRLPAKYEPSAEHDEFFQHYRLLEKHGYATIRKVSTTDPYGGAQIGSWEVSLTPKWTADLGNTFSSDRCVGHWKAQSVKSFTPPVEADGVTSTWVTVTGTQAYEGWAADPELQTLFHLTPLPESRERVYGVVGRSGIWEVLKVREADQ